ncbi:uncharacterized protein [Elaeis guineensis]|uniref:uncharacterized protein n=1 Tax=Elaeis guineensis var. tenera TaxID=51953 RepID=UPI003C6D16E7
MGTALLVIALEVRWGTTRVMQISTANPLLVLKSEDKLKDIMSDKNWMKLNDRASMEYINGVHSFLNFAFGQPTVSDRIRCPCTKCRNTVFKGRHEVRAHLIRNGIVKSYKHWVYHSETIEKNLEECNANSRDNLDEEENTDYDDLIGMVLDACAFINTDVERDDVNEGYEPQEPNSEAAAFYRLLKDVDKNLYPGCDKVSKLSFAVKLLHLKCSNNWSDTSMDKLLKIFKEVLPNGALVPNSFYEAKKLIQDLGLEHIKIDACLNDCVIYWREHANAIRLYMSKITAKDMRWHEEKRINDGILRHPADSFAWKSFDDKYKSFSADPRSVRLGLANDGFQPFRNMSTPHSIWPVVLIPYNLPPWQCMKDPYFMMTLLIPGPKCPENDIDVYLQPLIEELKELWDIGVETYDAHTRQNFNLHAAVLWTINDFSTYEIVLDIKGKTKDTLKGRFDLVDMNIRHNLHPYIENGKLKMPVATYTLSPQEKIAFCNFLSNLRVPDGFSSNISRCVNINEKKISGLKCHDHHILLQQILPVAIRGLLPKFVCELLIELTFFDIMIHLPIHLASEAKISGPVQYRWMYPVERYLRTLKSYVRNKARPEGSIARDYLANECLTFCSRYLNSVETKFNRVPRNDDGATSYQGLSIFAKDGCAKGAFKSYELNAQEFTQAQAYVLRNCEEVWPYIEEHKKELEEASSRNVLARHHKEFPDWFYERVSKLKAKDKASEDLLSLVVGPFKIVHRYGTYIVNRFRFHARDRAIGRKSQNSGVLVKGDDTSADKEYYGVLEDIFELLYVGNKKVVLFKSQQVFYVEDLVDSNWLVVVKTYPRDAYDVPSVDNDADDDDDDDSLIEDDVYQQEE